MSRGRIPKTTIDQIRGRVDLVRLVEEAGVSLRRRGKNYIGKCPFHQDDTPSFSVSPEKQLYHCFGCGASGTVFTFLAQREQIPFEEAVEKLAARAGVTLKHLDATALSAEEQSIAAANRLARDQFHEWLMSDRTGRAAREYLHERGLRDDTIRTLRLGFAPDGWDNLLNAMTRGGFGPEALVKAGLLRENERGNRYDYFRNRIIFPINDLDGEVVAFGGRALDDATPKYLNSPETPVYTKGEVLYLLDRSRRAIARERTALVTEGYFDAISLYQAGVENVVASLGTALSDSHARLLKRYTEEVIFVFDGDEAGSRAVLRGAPHFLREGFRAKVVILPEGSDPDSFIREKGADALRAQIDEAVPVVEFSLRSLARDVDLTDAETKIHIIEEMAPLLRSVASPILLREYAQRIAEELEIHPKDAWRELRRRGVSLRTPPPEPDLAREPHQKPRVRVERGLLTCLLSAPDCIAHVFEQLSPTDFTDPRHRELARIMWNADREQGNVEPHFLMEACYDDEVRSLIAELLLEARPLPNMVDEVQAHVRKIIAYTLREMEWAYLESKLQDEPIDEVALARELTELAKQRRAMEREAARPDDS